MMGKTHNPILRTKSTGPGLLHCKASSSTSEGSFHVCLTGSTIALLLNPTIAGRNLTFKSSSMLLFSLPMELETKCE
jgi:hypothetical protein